MSEIRRDEIVYEEGWRDATDGDTVDAPAEEASPEPEKRPDKKEKSSRPILTILQLVVCMAAALVLFVLKAMDSGAYHSFMKAYAEEMSKPVISQELFDAVDWNAMFGAGPATVKSTPDELPPR